MSYQKLSWMEKHVLDVLMRFETEPPYLTNAAKEIGIGVRTVKHHVHNAYRKYGIDGKRYHCLTRLMYLRAKELGWL